MKPRVALLLATLSLLAGCASVPPEAGCIQLGRAGQFCPLPPAALPAVSASQMVTVVHDGQSQTFIGRLQVDAHDLRLAGLSLFGTELFTLDYDGQHISSHGPRGNVHPELLLAVLELTLAPAVELPPRLRNLTFTVNAVGNREVRELWESGRLIARIEKAGPPASAHLHIEIPPAKLTLRLVPLNGSREAP